MASCKPYLWESADRGPGLRVWNAHTQTFHRVWLVFIRIVEDGAGLQKPLHCHKQPARIGASLHASRHRSVAPTDIAIIGPHFYHRLTPFLLFIDSIVAGACPWCDLVGFWGGTTMHYPGAVALVDAGSPAAVLWRTYTPPPVPDDEKVPVSDKPTLASLYDAHVNKLIADGIHLRSSAEALASGIRGERCRTKVGKKLEPFPGVSIYCKLFPGTINQ